MLNVAGTLQISEANGPGLRAVIWVQGCTLGCHGCCNEDMQPHTVRSLVPVEDLVEWISSIYGIEGITVSGGEPFEQAEAVAAFLEGVRKIRTTEGLPLSIFIYAGYEYDYLRDSQNPDIIRMLGLIDILCAGPFVLDKKDEGLLWRGSSNQKLIYLTNRYSKTMEPVWLMNSPVDEVTIRGGLAIST